MSSILEDTLLYQIKALGLPEPIREYRAIPGRRFKWDFCWDDEDQRLLVEIQGGTYVKSGHSTGKGIARDMEKLNLATLAGWRVMQFDRKMIENGTAVEMIKKALETK